jgi:hypothetical protein
VRYPAKANTLGRLEHSISRLHVQVEIRNISRSGVGILLNQGIDTGMVMEIELVGSRPIRLEATVMHCYELYEDCWVAGLAFSRGLTQKQLEEVRAGGSTMM